MAERKLSPQKVLFSTFFAPAAATAEGSLSALPGRMAVAPCTKFSAELREALLGLGRIDALCHRSSALYQIR